MASTPEDILGALHAQLIAYFENWGGDVVSVARNTALPEMVPQGGLIILRDGEPGDPDTTIGDVGPYYYQHEVTIEAYIEDVDAASRDAQWKDLIKGAGAALRTDHSLGGRAFGMKYGQPAASTTAVEGAEDIKSGEIRVTIDYETETRI